MNLENIILNLNNKKGLIDKDIINNLQELKQIYVRQNDQNKAKEIWCIQQVIKIKNHYINAFNNLKKKKYFEAWKDYERVEVEFTFLRRHFNYSNNLYNLEFIECYSRKFQKLFPYVLFMSRESIIKKSKCSICGKEISLRKSCGHKIGEIYNGEMCFRNVVDMEFLAMAIVKNPADKFAVLFLKDKEYDYSMLQNLINYLDNPYDKWDLKILKELNPKYKNVGRNEKCPCGSQKKYKKCCLKNDNDKIEHYKIVLYDKAKKQSIPKTLKE
ncbi:YecA family protein [Clostridium novyi]|uniref:SEC-C motif domain protein n=1 Tax=Clostridium novyi (strain NT) TaxID=386415 RepID=A0Q0V3_CLONN|nr:SEC-C metal-binding domain-containing protein [Clostridium novyi]ABK61776.1 SEC-C motif domain protein [Clostridium novyi NT]KEH88627.1 zinc chelation protein SecC [Clostridium novyi A str. NCTC 538]